MDDQNKTKQALIHELTELRCRNAELAVHLQTLEGMQEALRKSEGRLELALNGAQLGLWDYNLQTGDAFISPQRATMLGYSPEELDPHFSSWGKLVHPDDIERVTYAFNAHVQGQTPIYQCEHRLRNKDGEYVWVLARAKVVEWDSNGNPVRLVGTSLDVSDRKQAEEELQRTYEELECRVEERTAELAAANAQLRRQIAERKRIEEALKESEEKFRSVVQSTREGVCVLQDGVLKFVNSAMLISSGYSEDEVVGRQFVNFIYPEDREEAFRRYSKEVAGQDQSRRFTFRFVDKSGNIRWLEGSTGKISWEGKPGVSLFGTDISERRLAEEALQDSERTLKSLLAASPVGMLFTQHSKIKWANEAWMRMFGFEKESEFIDQPTRILHPSKENYERVRKTLYDNIEPGKVSEVDAKLRKKDGSEIDAHIRINFLDPSDPAKGTISAISDISDRKRSEEELRRSEERLELALRGANLGLWDWNLRAGLAVWDQRSLEMLGYAPGEIQPDLRTFKSLIHPGDWPKVSEVINGHMEGRLPTFDLACRFRTKSGEWRWILSQGKIVAYDSDGKPLRMTGTSLDITERKLAEQERESLRAQLAQAQKMEAIGTLTGGIAHEFNNLLTIVLGYAELALAEKKEGESAFSDLQKIVYAAQRGAELVRSLLTFSRRSEMNLTILDFNHEVKQVKTLLDRTLPKIIEIKLDLFDGLRTVEADSGQIRQVLMNIALNARDAMPEGGKLTIRTANIDQEHFPAPPGTKPADCVLLTVSDTGMGMEKETLNRIFDPFYSAKGLAYKTGLGLAVAHGIIEQHGGSITCESEPGKGTTFKMRFPVADERESNPISEKQQTPSGSETILIVDDEEYVRDLATRILTRAGYRVITAEDGRKAVDVYNKEMSRISLVILDLIMPRVGGKQCLEELLKIHPGLKVLIASGYSDAKSRDDLLQAGAKGFVGKPFQMSQLLKTIRKVLDETE